MAKMLAFECAYCGKRGEQSSSAVNRARRIGAPLYCGKDCAGMARRKGFTIEQRKERKAEYDRQRREALGEELLAKKRAAYESKKDDLDFRRKQKELRDRQKRNGYRAQYLAQDRYKRYKNRYDANRRSQVYGEFEDCYRLLIELKREIVARCPNYYERHAETIKERTRNAKRSKYPESGCR